MCGEMTCFLFVFSPPRAVTVLNIENHLTITEIGLIFVKSGHYFDLIQINGCTLSQIIVRLDVWSQFNMPSLLLKIYSLHK